MREEPPAALTGAQYVNNLWIEFEPVVIDASKHSLSTDYPPGYSQSDALRKLIGYAFDRGKQAAMAGIPQNKNPFDVLGLSDYGHLVMRAWDAGHLTGEQSK